MGDDSHGEIAACFEGFVTLVREQEWERLFETYEPACADQFLLAAAVAAHAHVADTGEGEDELEALHAWDGGPMNKKGWPASVGDKPALFAKLMEFSEDHENGHSPLPLVDWDEVSLVDVRFASATQATASLVEGDENVPLRFAEVAGRWRWALGFEGEKTTVIFGDHPPRGESHPPATSPEEDVALAEELIESGELAHAAKHVAAALGTDPNRQEWRELLDEIARRSSEPTKLFEVGGKRPTPFTEVAGHAHLLAFTGETQQALDLIGQVVGFIPRRGYSTWAAEWLRRHEGRFDAHGLFGGLAQLFGETVGFLRLRPTERAVFEEWAPVALALLDRPRTDKNPSESLAIASGLLRRAGRLDDAERAARDSLECLERLQGRLTPSGKKAMAMSLSALGLALRAKAKWDEALLVFGRASELDPSSPFAAERVRVFLDAGRLDEAARELPSPASDLELEALRAWLELKVARPAKTGWLSRIFGSEPKRDPQLDDLAKRLPEKVTGDTLRELWVHAAAHLPVPMDATSNGVRDLHKRKAVQPELASAGSTLELTLSALEAPSGRLAMALELGGDGSDLSMVKYQAKAISEPDPRRPRRPVRDVIWIYGGPGGELAVRQALPPPGEVVRRAVVELAASPYFLSTWWERSRRGRELGPGSVDEILGAMVHPPRPPEATDSAEWVFRNQLAGALLLAHVDEGWKGSRRREALFSLVDGVMDWTTDAAILALREIALDEPATFDEIEARFWQLKDEAPKTGHCWFLGTLARSYLRLPGTPADRREAFEAICRDERG